MFGFPDGEATLVTNGVLTMKLKDGPVLPQALASQAKDHHPRAPRDPMTAGAALPPPTAGAALLPPRAPRDPMIAGAALASPERDHMDLVSLARDHMVAGANGGKFIMSSIVHHHSYAR